MVIGLFGFIFCFYNCCFYYFLSKTSVKFALKCFSLYLLCFFLSLCFCSIFFVLLDIVNMSWVFHTCALSRIVPRCIYFVYFALVVWLDMPVIISDCYFLHVQMNIYLLYVHWSHSLMTVLYDQDMLTCFIVFTYLIAFYLLMYVPCTQLVISLMKFLSVCKCFRLQVYTCKWHTTSRLGVSEFCHCSKTHV